MIFAPTPGFAVLRALAIVAAFLRPGSFAESFRLSVQLAGAAAGQLASTLNEPVRETAYCLGTRSTPTLATGSGVGVGGTATGLRGVGVGVGVGVGGGRVVEDLDVEAADVRVPGAVGDGELEPLRSVGHRRGVDDQRHPARGRAVLGERQVDRGVARGELAAEALAELDRGQRARPRASRPRSPARAPCPWRRGPGPSLPAAKFGTPLTVNEGLASSRTARAAKRKSTPARRVAAASPGPVAAEPELDPLPARGRAEDAVERAGLVERLELGRRGARPVAGPVDVAAEPHAVDGHAGRGGEVQRREVRRRAGPGAGSRAGSCRRRCRSRRSGW